MDRRWWPLVPIAVVALGMARCAPGAENTADASRTASPAAAAAPVAQDRGGQEEFGPYEPVPNSSCPPRSCETGAVAAAGDAARLASAVFSAPGAHRAIPRATTAIGTRGHHRLSIMILLVHWMIGVVAGPNPRYTNFCTRFPS